MARTLTDRTADDGTFCWRTGAVAGIAGAVFYTVFVEVVNVLTKGTAEFFFPFRQIGAVVLGPGALKPSYNVFAAAAAGTVVHLVIAAAFGIAIAWVTGRLASLSAGTVIALGLIAGLALYALNVFVVFPAAFPWFLANSRLTQSLGHALFGAVTGAWLAWRRPATMSTGTAQ